LRRNRRRGGARTPFLLAGCFRERGGALSLFLQEGEKVPKKNVKRGREPTYDICSPGRGRFPKSKKRGKRTLPFQKVSLGGGGGVEKKDEGRHTHLYCVGRRKEGNSLRFQEREKKKGMVSLFCCLGEVYREWTEVGPCFSKSPLLISRNH